MTILVQAFIFAWATCALSQESCGTNGDSCSASGVDHGLDSEVPSVSLLQSQLEKTRAKVHAHDDHIENSSGDAKHASVVHIAETRKKVRAEQAKQISNKSLLSKRSSSCETTKVYKGDGKTTTKWGGSYVFATECAAACAELGWSDYTFWPECGKDDGCGCRCASDAASFEDTDSNVVSGDTDCDTCSYACSDCGACSHVDRLGTTYTGLEGGTISWPMMDPETQSSLTWSGYCFTPLQSDKNIQMSFFTGNGDEEGVHSLSDISYEAGKQVCYVGKKYSAGYNYALALYKENADGGFDHVFYKSFPYASGTYNAVDYASTFQLKFVDADAQVSDIEYQQFSSSKTPWSR